MKTYLILFVLILISICNAQLPHTFTQTAHIDDGGTAMGIAIDSSGTIFLANYDDGSRVYTYNGNSFSNIAHGFTWWTEDILAPQNNIVFLAAGHAELRAYYFDGSSFGFITRVNEEGYSKDLTVGPNGTIFLANYWDGLRAYNYYDSLFYNTAHINDGGGASSVAVNANGIIFVANDLDGLRAYSYNGNSFTNTAHIDNGGCAMGVAVWSDSIVYLANYDDGLRAYIYNGNSFTNTAHIDDGSIYKSYAVDVVIGIDGTVFLANNYDGLYAYSYDGSSFTKLAHINDGGVAKSIAIGLDRTIFLANGYEGLMAYEYSGYTSITTEPLNKPIQFSLSQNYPNPFNPITNIEFSIPITEYVTLKIYNLLGQEVITLVSEKLKHGKYKYSWDAGSLASGVYLYHLQAGEFAETRKMILIQ